MQHELKQLMKKDMDRKDFLKHVGIGFAAIVGVTGVVKTIASLNGSQTKQQTAGYGSSVYGGHKSDASKSKS